MTVLLDDFHKIVARVKEEQRKKAQAEGALTQILKRIKEEFGCKSLKDARRLLNRLEREEIQLAKEFTDALDEFKRKFGARLSGD